MRVYSNVQFLLNQEASKGYSKLLKYYVLQNQQLP